MENDAVTLYCPNDQCQAPNPLNHKFCQRCSTVLPKRYLWAVEEETNVCPPGAILADRYLVIDKSILLDTKPGETPQTPDVENLQLIKPYLRLFPYRLYVPQVYGVLSLDNGNLNRQILLLEKSPFSIDSNNPQQVQLCSELVNAWRDATSMRQLNWLWQIANLWQPLISEGVASSLLDHHVLRVEGPLVRLLQLRFDEEKRLTLAQLGEFWQLNLRDIKPAISDFFSQICQLLIQGEIKSAEQLVAILDKGLAQLGRQQEIKITITTKTDTGPSRQRNEDACYPPSDSLITKPPQQTALTIVCDGIGGHEGGNLASSLAIETIQQRLQSICGTGEENLDPQLLITDLEEAAAIANDQISQRNDSEHRQGRQRMGTTLVMALPVAHEIYMAHVGDSRAYWITQENCYQVTIDDDVASREVRLGYALYRDAVQQGASGSLVQALGMSPSISLHPTAQRFVLDEDCVFLLCSDGLSDFDRVEQYWDTEILPILTENYHATNVANRLVEIANTQNGHDNVTVALLHCQVQYTEAQTALAASLADVSSIPTSSYSPSKTAVTQNLTPNAKTQVLSDTTPTKRTSKSPWPLIIPSILLIFAAVSFLAYFATRHLMSISSFPPLLARNTQTPTVNPTPTPTTAAFPVKSLWEVNSNNIEIPIAELTPSSANSQSLQSSSLQISSVTILQVLNTKPIPSSGDQLLQLKVFQACPVTNSGAKSIQHIVTTSEKTSAFTTNHHSPKAGEVLWIKASDFQKAHPKQFTTGNPPKCQ